MIGSKRSAADFQQEASEQFDELCARCSSFDSGKSWEAKSIAVSLYKFLQDGRPPIRSILSALGLREQIEFLGTSIGFGPAGKQSSSLTREVIDNMGVFSFQPMLGRGWQNRWMKFQEWWNEPIFRSENGETLSRHELVFSLRSQDGGAHVDEAFKHDSYVQMSRGKPTTTRIINGDTELELTGAHKAAIRQIAWEFIESLKKVNLVQ